MNENAPPKDTLYYDGQCPLCSAEVCKLSELSQGRLELRDIHQLNGSEDLPEKERLLERLHLLTSEGEWLVGIDANVRAWQGTRYGPLWRVLSWPVIRWFSALAYELWLWLRRSKAK